MIQPDKRVAIITLYQAGRPKRAIARLLEVDIKTVRHVLKKDGDAARSQPRRDKIEVDEELLRQVYERCDGYRQRVFEVLTEEYHVEIGYSTLTQRLRELGIGQKHSDRSHRVPDSPGAEMQHDTSPFEILIGGKKTKVICSGLYLRYSKLRYVRFYRSFNRFAMKCFMDEALRFWGYCAKVCVIDNTGLAIWYGTGARAVMTPEMTQFAKHYGFEWLAHALNHANRKAGKERNFKTVMTNFFPGRVFSSMDSLNQQAFDWATRRYAQRPQAKTGLIPVSAFEHEKSYLVKLPDYITPPYQRHERRVDQYGYIAFKANYYWVPKHTKTSNEKIIKVSIIEYASHITLYCRHEQLLKYDLPTDVTIKNRRFAPEGVNLCYQPKHRKKNSLEEEKVLRSHGQAVCGYVDFILSPQCRIKQKHHFIRKLYTLSQKMAGALFLRTIDRALAYRVDNIDALSKIAMRLLSHEEVSWVPEEEAGADDDYKQRETYQKGRFCQENGSVNLDLFENNPPESEK